MRAVVYRGANDLRLETVPVPPIQSDELLVKVAACGVCPTDIKKIQYGTVPPPRIFGHETAGTIVRIGARVKKFREGDRVALHHHVPCLDCHACRHRAFAQCAQYKRTGITAGFEPAGGGYAEYVRVMSFVLPGVVRIPSRNTFLEGAMLEPVNTVLKAIHRLALLRGDFVLVTGQGPIGLMFTRLLALRGMNVVATDLLPARLELAKKFGARWTFGAHDGDASALSASQSPLPMNLVAADVRRLMTPNPKSEIRNPKSMRASSRRLLRSRGSRREIFRGNLPSPGGERAGRGAHSFQSAIHRGFDAAIVTAPGDPAVRQAQELVRGGGQVLLFAHTRRENKTQLDLSVVCVDEKDLIGSYSSDVTLQGEAARLVFGRKLDARELITHCFPLEQTAEAVQLAARPSPESLKIVVTQGDQEVASQPERGRAASKVRQVSSLPRTGRLVSR
ncbi:MAG: hypothetical protein DME23_18455 [Verrucomicrobia bacterium]|nr:MAG: hypothetical protein DME23_18455 [Verrucomicrobiota bacterium]